MARIISAPKVIPAAGEPPKIIQEFIGQVNSGTSTISVAKMTSPSGWSEPGQTPEFDEYTIVLRGELQVETREAVHGVSADSTKTRAFERGLSFCTAVHGLYR